jgi:protease I
MDMADSLHGKKIAILATDGFEQVELTEPRKALDKAGATTEVVSLKSGEIKGWKFKEWGDTVKVDKTLDQAKVQDYDALLLPGGVMNPDHLRMEPKAVQFVKDFVATGRPVAAICHAPWTLVEAGVVKGKTLTSWPSVKTDLKNAGANWVDKEVVTDGQFISSRKPDDIPAFSQALIEALGRAKEKAA